MYSKEKYTATMGDSVYYSLRKNIMHLNLKPGESINIKEISEQLEVSRSPVRDSIIKLEKEGLITSIPKKGTIISKIDLKRVSEERFLRQCLEEKVTLLFLDCYSDSHINKLQDNIKKQKESIENNDIGAFLEYDDQFHEIFFKVTNKMLCLETLRNMSGHYRRVRFMTLWDVKVVEYVINQHEQLLKFIIDRNIVELKKLIEIHLSQQDKEEKMLIEKYPDFFEPTLDEEESEISFLKKDFLKMMR